MPSNDMVLSSERLGLVTTPDYDIPEACWDIYCEYLSIFKQLFGFDEVDCLAAGYTHRYVEAEWDTQGKGFYHNSIMLPLRNAYYSALSTENRWLRDFEKLNLKTPLVDYGCGVGFLLVYFSRMGMEGKLMGWELPGSPQHRVMMAMFKRYDIGVWDGNSHVETIVCNHVLEHLNDPMSTVETLRSKCNQLYTNCDESEDTAHIAPMAIRRQVNDDLRRRGEHTSQGSL